MTPYLYISMGLALLGILQSYVFFPLFLKMMSRKPKLLDQNEILMDVSIFIAVHNEEEVIDKKLRSIFNSSYPVERLKVYIGNDVSTDGTVEKIKEWQNEFPQIRIVNFKSRSGKPYIINQLAELSLEENTEEHIMILTDANVYFEPDMIGQLVSHNMADGVGLVAAHAIFNIHDTEKEIYDTENQYNRRELVIKEEEGRIYGTMMGPFGACFSMRSGCWKPVPDGYIVDDFWSNMSVLSQGYKTILAPEAKAYEYMIDDAKSEYRRKVRMSTGNMQNLFYFKNLLFSSTKGLSFCYWSHKVLRWLTPFFMIWIYICIWVIYLTTHELKSWLIVIHVVLFLIIIDLYLGTQKVDTGPIRKLRHFFMMNVAMLEGYSNYFRNKKSNIWQPTARKKTT